VNDLVLRAAIAAVRAWTSFYTWGLPDGQRGARRDEIDSDLWESVNDRAATRGRLALHIAARLIVGIPDDLGWRSEHGVAAGSWRMPAVLTVLALALFGLWLAAERTTSAQLPALPESLMATPHGVTLIDAPPPPPPPPPPCAPPGFAQPSGKCTR
jgi:hypothetical protein